MQLVVALVAAFAVSANAAPPPYDLDKTVTLLQRLEELLQEDVKRGTEQHEKDADNAVLRLTTYNDDELEKRNAYYVTAKKGKLTVYPQFDIRKDAECRKEKNCEFSIDIFDDTAGKDVQKVTSVYAEHNGITFENLDEDHEFSIETCKANDDKRCNCYTCSVDHDKCPAGMGPKGKPHCNCVREIGFKKGKNKCRKAVPKV